MNGQMKSFKEKQKIADDYILRTNPYEKEDVPFMFDLRGYAAYVTKNNLGQEEQKKIARNFIR